MSFAHLLNDTVQAIIPAIYPLLKESFQLSFGQVGLITLTFQLTASILQPIVGLYADHRPVPFSLATGMGVTLVGLILLSVARQLCSALDCRRAGWPGFINFPPRGFTGGAPCLRRETRVGAISLSSRRQRRHAPLGRCWRRSLSFRMDKQISGGSRWLLLLASSCSSGSEGGINKDSPEVR